MLAITLVLCAAAIVPARKIYFDYNLLNMQSEGLPAVDICRAPAHEDHENDPDKHREPHDPHLHPAASDRGLRLSLLAVLVLAGALQISWELLSIYGEVSSPCSSRRYTSDA